ncbi:MAG: hypothetical protein ACI9MC_002429 [Kiritimatiellia bacterium]|jgi:hypothetical protein
MINVRSTLSLALMLASCSASQVDFNCVGDAPFCEIVEAVGQSRPLASGVRVMHVELNQGVAIELSDEGVATETLTRAVSGRKSLVRVFAEHLPNFKERPVAARIYVFKDDVLVGAGQSENDPSLPSDAAVFGSTFNIYLPPQMLPEGDLEWSVELVESGDKHVRGFTDDAVSPAEGRGAFTATYTGASTKIYIVPIENADTVGLSDEYLTSLKTHLFAWYPVNDLELIIGEPYAWPTSIQGAGHQSSLLQAMGEVREERNIPGDQYVYGLHGGYGGGLSMLAGSPESAGQRISVGGWGPGVVGHEVGHAHGRRHANCPLPGEPGAPAGQDENYPHERGSIGVWGWQIGTEVLFDPSEYTDYMSYCGPGWTSDYTWRGLLSRNRGIHLAYYGDQAELRQRQFRELWFHPDGSVTWGSVRSWSDDSPIGWREATLFDHAGQELGSVEGGWLGFNHVEGGVMLLPAATDVVAVDLTRLRMVEIEAPGQ